MPLKKRLLLATYSVLILGIAAYGAWEVRTALATGRYTGRHHHVTERSESPAWYWASVAFASLGTVTLAALGGLGLYGSVRSTAAEDRRIDRYLRKRADERKASE